MFDNYFFIYLFGVKIADKDEDEMEKFTDMQYVLQGHKFNIKYGIWMLTKGDKVTATSTHLATIPNGMPSGNHAQACIDQAHFYTFLPALCISIPSPK